MEVKKSELLTEGQTDTNTYKVNLQQKNTLVKGRIRSCRSLRIFTYTDNGYSRLSKG